MITYRNHPIEIVDTYENAGIKLATVRTLDGTKPFVGGTHYPVATEFAIAPVAELKLDAQTRAVTEQDILAAIVAGLDETDF